MRVVIFGILFYACICSAFAQDIWMPQQKGSYISAEYLAPSLNANPLNIGIQDVVLSGALQLKNGNRFKFELPMVWYNQPEFKETFYVSPYTYTYTSPEVKSSGVGNLSFSYEITRPDTNVTYEIGIRLPMASETEPAPVLGAIADYDRLEMYVPDYMTLNFSIHVKKETDKYFFGAHFSPSFLIRTGSSTTGQSLELLLGASVQGGVKLQDFTFSMGYSGRFDASDNMDFADRFVHQIGAVASYKTGQFQPSVFLRAPIDKNLEQALNFVYGIGVAYAFE